MSYAAQLIDAVKATCGLKTDGELATALGVNKTAVSQWKNGHGSPMPEERVLQLCAMAKIADPAPWLAGVHADGVRDPEARKRWESLLDRLPPSIARAAMLGAVLLGYFALPVQAHASTLTMQAEQAQAICIMRSVSGPWLVPSLWHDASRKLFIASIGGALAEILPFDAENSASR